MIVLRHRPPSKLHLTDAYSAPKNSVLVFFGNSAFLVGDLACCENVSSRLQQTEYSSGMMSKICFFTRFKLYILAQRITYSLEGLMPNVGNAVWAHLSFCWISDGFEDCTMFVPNGHHADAGQLFAR